ncbi:MAG TPA: UDP-N-acetylglucosamine 2-epimerase [Nitrosopumilaceae archaeon]|nr:UDP-N-acetylglucosamine 2-epimerase [Nitrosopumilaceae archaeon]
MKRKILIVTERRADYSKFKPILGEIKKSKKLRYYLIVTGSHLLKSHGKTINEIKNDDFKITSTFPMYEKNKSDTGAEMVRSFGRSVLNLSYIIEKLKPDIILSGFDIGANFASAIIGAHINTVVAHVEGGEVTGTIDESIRHATTKFAHLHFTSNFQATKRIIKMGEDPRFVYTVGNPSLDGIIGIKNIPRKTLERKYGLDLNKPLIIMLQHTVTSEVDKIGKHVLETIEAIKEMNIQALIIYGNADAGSKKISEMIKHSTIKQYATVPFDEYINLLKHASALIGNSSSGIIEAPFLHVPSINIGTRQDGRLRADSIIDVDYNKRQIKKAIKKTLEDKKFLIKVKKCKSLYGDGNASKKIVHILENLNLKKIPIQKKITF